MNYILNGIFPHSENLIKVTRDFERRRASYDNVLKALQDEREALFRLQGDTEFYTDGLLNWHDLLRPFETILSDCQSGTLVRYFQTNSFYRMLHFGNAPKVIENKLDDFFATFFSFDNVKKSRLYVLPSPCLFFRYSDNISQSRVNEILTDVVEYIDYKMPGTFIFAEPFLSDEPVQNPGTIATFFDMIRKKTKSHVFIHTYFGNIVPRLKFYSSLPVDGIGVDFYRTPFNILAETGWDREKALIAEIVDTENSLIEDEKNTAIFIEKIRLKLNPADVYVSGNADFYFLPYDVAIKKINVLKNISRQR